MQAIGPRAFPASFSAKYRFPAQVSSNFGKSGRYKIWPILDYKGRGGET